MCGIFGVIGKENNAAQIVIAGLKKMEYRGYDSWGISVKANGKLVRERHVGRIGQAQTSLPSSRIGLGHTRWATHGGVTEGNAHPHLSCNHKLCLVHNGIVENFFAIKQSLKQKHQFSSETDTEVALHLFEEIGWEKGFKKIIGMNAFILMDADKEELIAVKNGSPLIIGLGKNANYIASDVWALLDHTKKVIFMEDYQAAIISQEKVSLFDVQSAKQIKPKITVLNWQKEQSRLGRFHHYMEKEIYDQPKVLANIVNQHLPRVNLHTKNFILGCGTAFYAALFTDYLLKTDGHDSEAIIGSEFNKCIQLLKPKQNLIVFSQSGETIDILEAVDQAKKTGLKIIALTNVLGSSLYRKADVKILLGAGQEAAVAATKSFSAMLALALRLTDHDIGKLTNITRNYSKKLVQKLKDSEHIFCIGQREYFPIALEAALKIKEVSYIHAEGFAAGELKQGPIALIETGAPCLIFGEAANTAAEMQARGGLIINIAGEPIPAVIQAQLLAYDLAVSRGLNPDKPRNLAKSVTVK